MNFFQYAFCFGYLIQTFPSIVTKISTFCPVSGNSYLTQYVNMMYILPQYQILLPITFKLTYTMVLYASVSQPPGRGLVPVPVINYTGPREVLLEFAILVF
jgi:hypothetical protein